MTTQGNEIQIGDGSLRTGDRVVYPNQGICRITGVEVKQIAAGHSLEMVLLKREEDGATVMVPRAKVMGIGLRKVATPEIIDEVFDYLASPNDDPQLDWKVRHRENADKMTGGGLFGTAEVLKGLHSLTRVRPLPQKERELYDSARHLLLGEIAAACGIPMHTAEDNLDYALFPPPGMKRKGVELKLLAPIVPIKPLRAAGEDDLGFDDDEETAEEPEAAPAAAESEKDEDRDEDEDGRKLKLVKSGARPKASKPAKAAPAKAAAKSAEKPKTARPAAKSAEKKAAKPAAQSAKPVKPARPAGKASPKDKAAKSKSPAKKKGKS